MFLCGSRVNSSGEYLILRSSVCWSVVHTSYKFAFLGCNYEVEISTYEGLSQFLRGSIDDR